MALPGRGADDFEVRDGALTVKLRPRFPRPPAALANARAPSASQVLLEFFFGDADAESETGALFVPWSSFGSSGHVEQPPNVREHFSWRHNDTEERRGGKPDFIDNGKTICRVSMLKS